MRLHAMLVISLLALALLGPAALWADDDDPKKAVALVFEKMDDALAKSDEAAFKEHWHAEAYEGNLVGGSGLPGNEVFDQGSREGWFLKPDMKKAAQKKGGWLVPCEIFSRKKNKAVDGVTAAVVSVSDRWVVLGAGEDEGEVKALLERFAAGKPLAPGR